MPQEPAFRLAVSQRWAALRSGGDQGALSDAWFTRWFSGARADLALAAPRDFMCEPARPHASMHAPPTRAAFVLWAQGCSPHRLFERRRPWVACWALAADLDEAASHACMRSRLARRRWKAVLQTPPNYPGATGPSATPAQLQEVFEFAYDSMEASG